MKQGRNKQTRNETGKDSAGFNSFETCFDGAIEQSEIKSDFNSSANYVDLETSRAERVNCTKLPLFSIPCFIR